MARTYRRPGGLAVLAAAATIGLAACSGSSPSPQVASLGSSGTGSETGNSSGNGNSAAPQPGNPTRLLDQWAACIRGHGDPHQADPVIDSSKDIDISMTNVPKSLENEVHGSSGPCSSDLLAAENALRGGQPAPTYNAVKAEKEAECIRESGFSNYPDPSPDGETDFNGTGIDPNSPGIQNATKACDKKIGIPYYGNGTSPPGVVVVTDCTAPPGVQCPSHPPGGNGPGGSG
jgi:hypothetical protein